MEQKPISKLSDTAKSIKVSGQGLFPLNDECSTDCDIEREYWVEVAMPYTGCYKLEKHVEVIGHDAHTISWW